MLKRMCGDPLRGNPEISCLVGDDVAPVRIGKDKSAIDDELMREDSAIIAGEAKGTRRKG